MVLCLHSRSGAAPKESHTHDALAGLLGFQLCCKCSNATWSWIGQLGRFWFASPAARSMVGARIQSCPRYDPPHSFFESYWQGWTANQLRQILDLEPGLGFKRSVDSSTTIFVQMAFTQYIWHCLQFGKGILIPNQTARSTKRLSTLTGVQTHYERHCPTAIRLVHQSADRNLLAPNLRLSLGLNHKQSLKCKFGFVAGQ